MMTAFATLSSMGNQSTRTTCRTALFMAMRSLLSKKWRKRQYAKEAQPSTVPDVIRRDGYPVEVHKVQTSDGYILELHRIPCSSKGPAVLLQHGLKCSSAAWVLAGPKMGLAYLLADQGYDVWMGNSRGNPYSTRHVTLTPGGVDGAFWQFSWHEMGVFDLPAEIDHVLRVTGESGLFFVGHSQGNTSFFVMAAELPEYNAKIKATVALSPVAYHRHISILPLWTLWAYKPLSFLLGRNHLFLRSSRGRRVLDRMCSRDGGSRRNKLCVGRLLLDLGLNTSRLDEIVIPAIFTHYPSSCAVRQIIHYVQIANAGRFQQFDFGAAANFRIYGSATPPEYNLYDISCPILIYYGLADYLNSRQDATTVYKQLAAPLDCVEVPDPKFHHLDFLWAKNVKKLLYDDVIARLNDLVNCKS